MSNLGHLPIGVTKSIILEFEDDEIFVYYSYQNKYDVFGAEIIGIDLVIKSIDFSLDFLGRYSENEIHNIASKIRELNFDEVAENHK